MESKTEGTTMWEGIKTVWETGVKSEPAFCLGPFIEKTNSGTSKVRHSYSWRFLGYLRLARHIWLTVSLCICKSGSNVRVKVDESAVLHRKALQGSKTRSCWEKRRLKCRWFALQAYQWFVLPIWPFLFIACNLPANSHTKYHWFVLMTPWILSASFSSRVFSFSPSRHFSHFSFKILWQTVVNTQLWRLVTCADATIPLRNSLEYWN